MAVLVTGAAGFIGFHTVKQLLTQGYKVIASDNMNDYYSVKLKSDRLRELGIQYLPLDDKAMKSEQWPQLFFYRADCADRFSLSRIFDNHPEVQYVIHLAAQAGVRYSIEHPETYIQSNLVGFGNILECCRAVQVKHLIYASSSSVYGLNREIPYTESQCVDHPISLYAATKKSNEVLAHAYSHLFQLPTTGLRFFTVYGPWGRPDMAPNLFAKAITQGNEIKVFNHGAMKRDFTFVDDVVEGIYRLLEKPPSKESDDVSLSDPSTSPAPFRILNIGNNAPVGLLDFISCLESSLGRAAKKRFLPIQPGDVEQTWADVSRLQHLTGYSPKTSLEVGVRRFADWFVTYYQVSGQREECSANR